MIKDVSILGEKWTIERKTDKEDVILKDLGGYCDHTVKKIIIRETERVEDSLQDLEFYEKRVTRHEIIHAFLDESGLMHESGWARNEEMVDWFAIQLPKIIKAMKGVEVL